MLGEQACICHLFFISKKTALFFLKFSMPLMEFLNEKKSRENGENGEINVGSCCNEKKHANGNNEDEKGLSVNFRSSDRKVLVIYTGGTIGMVNNPDGCKFLFYSLFYCFVLLVIFWFLR